MFTQKFLKRFAVYVMVCLFAAPTKITFASSEDIASKFLDVNERVMVAAHRGDWRHHPENSLSAIQGCIDAGVDVVEIDVRKTKDGYLVLMHDETVDRTTDGSGKVSDLTLSEIKELCLKEQQGGSFAQLTEEKVPTLEEAMNIAKDKILVNLDKVWSIKNDVYEVLEFTDTIEHAIFKSEDKSENIKKWLDSKSIKPYYMHILNNSNLDDLDNILNEVQPIAFEIVFKTDLDACVLSRTLNKIKGQSRIWGNTMWSSLCAGHTDYVIPSFGWQILIDRGFNIIQSDKPLDLINYIASEGQTKGQYYKIVNQNSGKVLTVGEEGEDGEDGSNVYQWSYCDQDNQKWIPIDVGGGYVKLVSKHSDKVLDVENASWEKGTNIFIWRYKDGNNQKWKISNVEDGYVKIIVKHTKQVVDVYKSLMEDGANIIQWKYNGNENEKWRFIPVY
jgi:glycerophosphoryl diester phosphodiesterase